MNIIYLKLPVKKCSDVLQRGKFREFYRKSYRFSTFPYQNHKITHTLYWGFKLGMLPSLFDYVYHYNYNESGYSVDDDGSEFQQERQSFTRKRKLAAVVPNGYIRIYKNDVIRDYATIFEYVLNSYDFSLFSSFFHTFTSRKVIVSNTINSKVHQLEGRNPCVYFLSLCCQLSFDRIMRLGDFQLVQKQENPNIIELNGSYTCKQHRLFDAMAGDIMELLISQFPNLASVGTSLRSSKRQRKSGSKEKENFIASSPPDDASVTKTEDFDDDERYFAGRFTSLEELSATCYSSTSYLAFSHVFDPLASPCLSPACSVCSNFRDSSPSLSSSSTSPSFSFKSGKYISLLETKFSRFPTPQSFVHHGTVSFTISLKTKLIEKISFIYR
jgi:hypothetical protein